MERSGNIVKEEAEAANQKKVKLYEGEDENKDPDIKRSGQEEQKAGILIYRDTVTEKLDEHGESIEYK